MDVYKLVREDERRALKAYFSAEPLDLVQAVEAALRGLECLVEGDDLEI